MLNVIAFLMGIITALYPQPAEKPAAKITNGAAAARIVRTPPRADEQRSRENGYRVRYFDMDDYEWNKQNLDEKYARRSYLREKMAKEIADFLADYEEYEILTRNYRRELYERTAAEPISALPMIFRLKTNEETARAATIIPIIVPAMAIGIIPVIVPATEATIIPVIVSATAIGIIPVIVSATEAPTSNPAKCIFPLRPKSIVRVPLYPEAKTTNSPATDKKFLLPPIRTARTL